MLIIAFIILLSLIGCGTKKDHLSLGSSSDFNDKPGIEGYVVAKEKGRILVVDPVPQDFSKTGGVSEFYNAIWFSNVLSDIKVGEKVQVWFDEVAESYPGQSKAKKIKVLKNNTLSGTDLTEAEAIQKALDQVHKKSTSVEVKAVKKVSYDPSTDLWRIQIKQGEETFNIEVSDVID
ncbi:YobA family protein [Bacillus sp. P2(2020)]|uniref:YobA family protein n=2 Tax=Calidifontibacillus erzurumensis TaxID=2741433 RepID=A0A8J8KDK4_9BACI|nr:YobA family protein [Calidifontibacillus erzurumensis]